MDYIYGKLSGVPSINDLMVRVDEVEQEVQDLSNEVGTYSDRITNLETDYESLNNKLNGKQDKLTAENAGENIEITTDPETGKVIINATAKNYNVGDGLKLDEETNTISVDDVENLKYGTIEKELPLVDNEVYTLNQDWGINLDDASLIQSAISSRFIYANRPKSVISDGQLQGRELNETSDTDDTNDTNDTREEVLIIGLSNTMGATGFMFITENNNRYNYIIESYGNPTYPDVPIHFDPIGGNDTGVSPKGINLEGTAELSRASIYSPTLVNKWYDENNNEITNINERLKLTYNSLALNYNCIELFKRMINVPTVIENQTVKQKFEEPYDEYSIFKIKTPDWNIMKEYYTDSYDSWLDFYRDETRGLEMSCRRIVNPDDSVQYAFLIWLDEGNDNWSHYVINEKVYEDDGQTYKANTWYYQRYDTDELVELTEAPNIVVSFNLNYLDYESGIADILLKACSKIETKEITKKEAVDSLAYRLTIPYSDNLNGRLEIILVDSEYIEDMPKYNGYIYIGVEGLEDSLNNGSGPIVKDSFEQQVTP